MKTLSLIAFMVVSNFVIAQSVMTEANSNKDVLRPTYNPPASMSNSARMNQGRPMSASQSWWPGFYGAFQQAVSSPGSKSEKKNPVNNK